MTPVAQQRIRPGTLTTPAAMAGLAWTLAALLGDAGLTCAVCGTAECARPHGRRYRKRVRDRGDRKLDRRFLHGGLPPFVSLAQLIASLEKPAPREK